MQKGRKTSVRTVALLGVELAAIIGGIVYLTVLLNSPASPADPMPIKAPTMRPQVLVFPTAHSRYHQTGHLQADGWVATPKDPLNVYLNYGPYTKSVPAGRAMAMFRLKIDNVTADNATVVNLDINDNLTQKQLGDITLTRKQFSQPNVYQDFQIPFIAPAHASLEFRTCYMGQGTVTQESVTIEPQR